eukprot:1559558-Amphidinium_carterae.2
MSEPGFRTTCCHVSICTKCGGLEARSCQLVTGKILCSTACQNFRMTRRHQQVHPGKLPPESEDKASNSVSCPLPLICESKDDAMLYDLVLARTCFNGVDMWS